MRRVSSSLRPLRLPARSLPGCCPAGVAKSYSYYYVLMIALYNGILVTPVTIIVLSTSTYIHTVPVPDVFVDSHGRRLLTRGLVFAGLESRSVAARAASCAITVKS